MFGSMTGYAKFLSVFLLLELAAAVKKSQTPDSHIIGGQDASFSSWPWQVGLISSYEIFCGGTLISYDVVITAAHCLEGRRKFNLNVVLGEYNRLFWEGYEQYIPVKRYELHPEYSNEFLRGFDIAVLFLERNATPSFRVRPIPGIAQQTLYYKTCDCFITGWGVQSSGNPAATSRDLKPSADLSGSMAVTLQEARIEVITNSKCNSKRYWDGLVKTTNLCAFYKGTAACEGDSGGPLVCKVNDQYTLVGVTSWGSSSCMSYPTVFVDVAKFFPWIEERTQKHRMNILDININDTKLEVNIDIFPGR